MPPLHTDHQSVGLRLRQPHRARRRATLARVNYPIRSEHPSWVSEELFWEMLGLGVGEVAGTRTWNADVNKCLMCI
ncbi:hypothetical protein CCR75_009834 [Bremia lactucae]|uniref:Uncharacterized protein n=1 Tax=Bremia lactucae TaxID=4779 RepID=A0A976FLY4_BRELC|nr:hypothetical protein CCR75_009834 [Bremia lactucae]